jgi:hypothetical protein
VRPGRPRDCGQLVGRAHIGVPVGRPAELEGGEWGQVDVPAQPIGAERRTKRVCRRGRRGHEGMKGEDERM